MLFPRALGLTRHRGWINTMILWRYSYHDLVLQYTRTMAMTPFIIMYHDILKLFCDDKESLYLRALENILNQYFPAVAGEWRGTLFGWQEIQKCARTQGVLTPQGHTLGPTSAISVTPRILLWKFDDLSNCKGSTPTWLPPSENFRRSAKHGQHDAKWQSSKFTSCGQDLLGSLSWSGVCSESQFPRTCSYGRTSWIVSVSLCIPFMRFWGQLFPETPQTPTCLILLLVRICIKFPWCSILAIVCSDSWPGILSVNLEILRGWPTLERGGHLLCWRWSFVPAVWTMP